MRVSTIADGIMQPWWLNFWRSYKLPVDKLDEVLANYQCHLCNPHSPFTSELEFNTYEDYTMFVFIFLCEIIHD